MIEGFRHFDFKKCTNNFAKFFVFCDYFLFIIDSSVSFFFIPGIIAAIFFHDFIIVGPMTVILFPMTVILFMIMLWAEKTHVYDTLGINLKKHYWALFCYMISYSLILSPTCIRGYCQEFLGAKRKWK